MFRARNIGVFEFDELIMFALHDGDGHVDLGQIARGIVRLRPLHLLDRFGKGPELVRVADSSGIVPGVPGETALNGRCEFKGLGATGIHVTGKVEDACDTRGGLSGEDQTGAARNRFQPTTAALSNSGHSSMTARTSDAIRS